MWVCVALIIIAAVGAWAIFRDVPTRTPAELYDRTEIFGGYTAYLSENLYVAGVHGSSMEPTFGEGDYVIWVEVNPSELKIGDVIIFEHGRLVAHRIVGVINQNGAYKWRTKGDNRAVADDKTAISAFLVTEDDLKGLVIGVVYGQGKGNISSKPFKIGAHLGESEYTGISIHPKTKKRVNHLASKSETYDQFINRVLDVFEKFKGGEQA